MTLSHLATRRVDATLLEQCARSGQTDSRQIAAHIRAGELDGIGNECALPVIVDEPKPRVWRITLKGWWLVAAVFVCWAVVVWG